MTNGMALSMNGDTFAALKNDMDTIINRTIRNMQMKGAETATITVKLSVSLENGSVACGYRSRNIVQPTFHHDISSVMQVKDKMSGQLTGDYELVFDQDDGTYYMRRVDDGQMDMFSGCAVMDSVCEEPESTAQALGDGAAPSEYEYDEPEDEG
jgi:hypothetical protein